MQNLEQLIDPMRVDDNILVKDIRKWWALERAHQGSGHSPKPEFRRLWIILSGTWCESQGVLSVGHDGCDHSL